MSGCAGGRNYGKEAESEKSIKKRQKIVMVAKKGYHIDTFIKIMLIF